MSVISRLLALKESDPEGFSLLQQMARNAKDPNLEPRIRINCAMALGNALGPLMMDGIRDEFSEEYANDPSKTMNQAIDTLDPKEPVYAYRYVRGAKVKVRVN